MPSQSQINARSKAATPTESRICEHRSWLPVGTLRCSCSNQPQVYGCAEPWVASGYCIPAMPATPGDGPIVTETGDSIVPCDDRRRGFAPWPVRGDETPRRWELICCDSCPWYQAPPPHVAALKRLGVQGRWDADSGHAPIVYVLPRQPHHVPDAIATYVVSEDPDIAAIVQATTCRLLIFAGESFTQATINVAAAAAPGVRMYTALQLLHTVAALQPAAYADAIVSLLAPDA